MGLNLTHCLSSFYLITSYNIGSIHRCRAEFEILLWATSKWWRHLADICDTEYTRLAPHVMVRQQNIVVQAGTL